MSTVRPYYSPQSSSAVYYDVLTDRDEDLKGDVAIYAGLVPPGSSILELGAGTGRVAIALAQAGYEVTGLDISGPMLEQAERKRSALPEADAARLKLVRGDLLSLALGRRYQAIIATFFTLAHLPPASWRKAFSGIARHLTDDGVVAIHLPRSDQMERTPPDPTKPVFRQVVAEDRVLTLFVKEQTLNQKSGRFDLTLDYVESSADGQVIGSRAERLSLYAADPVPYAHQVGLALRGDPIRLGHEGDVYIFTRAG